MDVWTTNRILAVAAWIHPRLALRLMWLRRRDGTPVFNVWPREPHR